MKQFKYSKWLILSLFATTPILGLQNERPPKTPDEMTPRMEPGYNASSRYETCDSYDFYFTGSFIYWQPIQENMELGLVSDNSADLDLVNGKMVDLDFKFKPGFKVGVGLVFDYDNWDTYLQYTWFRGTHDITSSLDQANDNLTLWPAWQIVPGVLQPRYKQGKESWKLRMDIIDWDLARSYYVGTKLTFRPFFGLRAAWIQQHVRIDYRNFASNFLAIWPTTHVFQRSNSFGIGPRAGIMSNWLLGRGFRIYANGEADILYTWYSKLRAHQESDVSTASHYTIRDNDSEYLRAHMEMLIGLGWGTYFRNNSWHMDLSADYGFQVFFDQNMFRNFTGDQNVGKSHSPNGNLYVQGLTITLRFDF